MKMIDTCTYQHKGFTISYDGEYGVWTATDPDGEFMTTIADLKEAMIYIENAAEDDYSQWNEEAEIIRRMENPEISGR